MSRDYINFDLEITPARRAGHLVTARCRLSVASVAVILPFKDSDIAALHQRLGPYAEEPNDRAAREFGIALFNSVMKDDVGHLYSANKALADREGKGLRLRLWLDQSPELRKLPWELLHSGEEFLVLSSWSPLVRYLAVSRPSEPEPVTPPLNVLVMAPGPTEVAELDVQKEWNSIRTALSDLIDRGLVNLDLVHPATLEKLQRDLPKEHIHIFHFIGHGEFDSEAGEGWLAMEDGAGHLDMVRGSRLGTILGDCRELRLAFINACKGARGDAKGNPAGVAHSLVQQGISSVVAMQFEISDDVAVGLAADFYASLASGITVDNAIAEARRAMYARGEPIEWATPVLYLRSPDGAVFDIGDKAYERTRAPALPLENLNFHVLGPVEALKGEQLLKFESAEHRRMLARLLATPGSPVATATLVGELAIDGSSKASADDVARYIADLRAEIGDAIHPDGDGYVIESDVIVVDATTFENDIAQAKQLLETSPKEAIDLIDRGLDLWQGNPFADVESPFLSEEAGRLKRLRIEAVEAKMDAQLGLGNHAELITDLERLTTEYPGRVRLRSQLMLALHRSGRTDEALRAFQKAKAYYAQELGESPPIELQELEAQVSSEDPSLTSEAGSETQVRSFLFTDLEDSTALWEVHQDSMSTALDQHNEIMEEAVAVGGGEMVKHTGDGIVAVFETVEQAARAAIAAQRALLAADWGLVSHIRARMAFDVGDVQARGDDYFGPVLNRCARIMAAGHGSQILMSADAQAELRSQFETTDLGEYRFKGLGRPQRVYQLLVPGLPDEFAPLRIDRAPPAMPRSSLTRTVRGYELREEVGRGDFGVVYAAYQPSVGRQVAVKVIRPEFVNQPTFVRRFEQEAQIVAQLEHPHIVSLYDYWRDPDGAYLVMRWLRSGSLRHALDRGPWNLDAALKLLDQIGTALAYAHRHGVVHRDLKPGNVLLDEDGNAYLSDFGIAARLFDPDVHRQPVSNSPAYVSPEETEGQALAITSDIYSLGMLVFEVLAGQRPPISGPLPDLADLRPQLPPGLGEVIATATATEPENRYQSVSAFLDAVNAAAGLRVATPGAPLTEARNPFKGLEAFNEADAGDFFGRDALIEMLLSTLTEHRLVSVVGPSGIGKSSAVKAGLVPALRAGRIPGSSEWLIVDMYPGPFPFEELEAALLRVAIDRPERLLDELQRDERGLVRMSKQIFPPNTPVVLIIDQFEELFTLTSDEDVRDRFLDSLVALMDDPRNQVRVLVTLRADFFDRPLRYAKFGDLLRRGMVAVAAPTEAELAESIARPAQSVGVHFEKGLVEQIVNDVGDEPGTLPLLQYALTQIFDARGSDTITLGAYQSAGGVVGALGTRADEIFAELKQPEQEAARQIFLRLAAVDEAGQVTRRRVRKSELNQLAIDPDIVERVLGAFGHDRLITFDRDPVTRGPTVEVAHEALLSRWNQLAGWVNERREQLVLHRRFSEVTAEWERAERGDEYLLTGGRLEQYKAWAESTDMALTNTESDFLSRSQSQAAAETTGRRLRRRAVLAGFAVAAVVALGLAGWAFFLRDQAVDAQEAADETAIELRARDLASASASRLIDDPQLATLLAIEAAEVTVRQGDPISPFAEAALHRALSIPWVRSLVGHEGNFVNRAFFANYSPNGDRIMTAGDDGTLRFWTPDGEATSVIEAHTDIIRTAEYSPDGTYILTGGDDGFGRIWDLEGQLLAELPGANVGWASFSPDSSMVVTGGNDAFARLWRNDGSLVAEFPEHPETVRAAAISSDNSMILTAADDGVIRLFEPTGIQLDEWSHHEGNIVSVAFSPDDSLVVTVGNEARSDRSIKIWSFSDVEPREHPVQNRPGPAYFSPDGLSVVSTIGLLDLEANVTAEFEGHTGRVFEVEANQDFTRFATSSVDGSSRIWDIDGNELAVVTGQGRLLSTAFQPGGERILTAHSDKIARLWNPFGSELQILAKQTRIDAANWDATGSRIVTFGEAEVATIVSLEDRPITLHGHSDEIFDAAFSPSGAMVVTASRDGSAVVWSSQGEQIVVLPGEGEAPARVMSATFSGDESVVVTVDNDGLGKVWDLDGTVVEILRGPVIESEPGADQGEPMHERITSARFTPDGGNLVTGIGSGSILMWDLEWNVVRALEQVHDGVVTDLWYSPDGLLLMSNGGDAVVRVWDADLNLVGELRGHSRLINHASFSPDSRRIVTASFDRTAILWEIDGTPIIRLLGHTDSVRTAMFAPDGNTIVTAATDDLARLFSTAGVLLAELRGHTNDVNWAAFTQSGNRVITASGDGTVRLWSFRTDVPAMVAEAQSNVQRDFTQAECDFYGIERCLTPAP